MYEPALTTLLTELRALPRGAAIFDLDGTLQLGDIGDAVVKRVFAMGHVTAHVRATLGEGDPWTLYQALTRRDWCGGAALASQALEGLTEAEVEQLADAAYIDGDVSPHTPVVALAAALADVHDVWILTASAEVLGRVAGRRLGIERVVGYRTALENGRFTSQIVLNTCGPAKVTSARQLISPSPVFSIGDSPSDLPLLRVAAVARTTGKSAGLEFPAFP